MMRVQLYNVCLGGVTSLRTLVFFFPFLISSVVTQSNMAVWMEYFFCLECMCMVFSDSRSMLKLEIGGLTHNL